MNATFIIHIHCNVTNMAELMAESEVALSAGGSTLYELCAVGVPVIAFSFAENQERLVQTFVKRGIAQYGGNYRTDGNKMIQNTIAGAGALSCGAPGGCDFHAPSVSGGNHYPDEKTGQQSAAYHICGNGLCLYTLYGRNKLRLLCHPERRTEG